MKHSFPPIWSACRDGGLSFLPLTLSLSRREREPSMKEREPSMKETEPSMKEREPSPEGLPR
jgi:hypothetical protein